MPDFRMIVWNMNGSKPTNSELLTRFMLRNNIGVAVLTEVTDTTHLDTAAKSAFGNGKYFFQYCNEDPASADYKPDLLAAPDIKALVDNDEMELEPTTKIRIAENATVLREVEYQFLQATLDVKTQGRKCAVLAVKRGAVADVDGVDGLTGLEPIKYQAKKAVIELIVDKKMSPLAALKAKKKVPRQNTKVTVVRGWLDALAYRRPALCTLKVNAHKSVQVYDFHAAEGGGGQNEQRSGRAAVPSNELFLRMNESIFPANTILAGDLNLSSKGVSDVYAQSGAKFVHAKNDRWTAVIYSSEIAVEELLKTKAKIDTSELDEHSDHKPMVVAVTLP